MSKAKRLYYENDGNKWAWSHDPEFKTYCVTNDMGEGIFYVDLRRNERKQILGTCQFSLRGIKNPKAKIRKWME